MDLQGMFALARHSLNEGAIDTAADLAHQLAIALPDHTEILSLQAEIALAQQDFSTAISRLKTITSLAPENTAAYLRLTEIHLHSGDIPNALLVLEAGITATLGGEVFDAAEQLSQIAASLIDNQSVIPWIHKYFFWMTTHKVRFLEKIINNILLHYDFDDITKYNMGCIAANNKSFEVAEEIFRNLHIKFPLSIDITKNLLFIFFHLEKFHDSIPLLEFLESTDNANDVAPLRAISYLQCGIGNQKSINDRFIQWGNKYYQERRPAPAMPAKKRPLRVGFSSTWLGLSPFLHNFLTAICPHLAQLGVEIYWYPFDSTEILKAEPANHYTITPLDGLSAEHAANIVRQDALHALICLDIVPLSWHAEFYRFSPAPLVFSLIHTLASQGGAVDVLIMDRWFVPPEHEQEFPEKIVRLSGSTVFVPPSPDAKPLEPPPCLRNGFITFGSFNRPHKIEQETAEAWAQAMLAVPEARLYLRSRYYDARETTRITALLTSAGVSADRISIEGPGDLSEFYSSFAKIDIALDPLRFNGGISTVEALWHGVPVITEPGDIVTSRISASVLATMGMDQWICPNRESWLATVTALARDPDALIHWRQELRPRLAATNICDGTLMAEDLLNTITPVIDAYYS